MCVCATDVTSACLRRSSLCGTVSPACNIGSGQLHVYIAPIHAVRYATPSGSALRPQAALNQSYLLTSLHNMEGSRSFMQLYKHQYQLHGMLIKNGLGWGWVWLQEQLNTQRLLVGHGLDAQRPWQAREKLMTYDRVPPAHYELLRGNLQKRERLGGEPTPMPWGRLEPGSLGKKERLSSEPMPRPWPVEPWMRQRGVSGCTIMSIIMNGKKTETARAHISQRKS